MRHRKAAGTLPAVRGAVIVFSRGEEGGNIRFQNSVKDGCPISGKEATLAAIEPHPHIPKESKRRIGDVMEHLPRGA